MGGEPATEEDVAAARVAARVEVDERLAALRTAEAAALAALTALSRAPGSDWRWVAIARTQIELGVMAAVRAVADVGRVAEAAAAHGGEAR